MKTCLQNLKRVRLVSLFVMVALASLILVSGSQGQITPKGNLAKGKTTTKKGTVDNGIITNGQRPPGASLVRPEVGLLIKDFSVVRDGGAFLNKIRLTGVIGNWGTKTSPGTTYTISRQDGPNWVVVKRGAVKAIASDGVDTIIVDQDMRYDAAQYKLEVTRPGSNQTLSRLSKRLPAMTFVVQYRAVNEVLYKHWNKILLPVKVGESPGEHKDEMTRLGFATRLETIKHSHTFEQDRFTYNLFIRNVNWQERTFKTPEAAERFRASLPRMSGVEIKVSHR
jgi:hypothetical protein